MSLIERALNKMRQGDSPVSTRLRVATHPERTYAEAPTAESGVRGVRSCGTVTLDLDALRSSGLLAPEAHERGILQQYRCIKRPLVKNAFGRDAPAVPFGRMIAVSSAVPGEGKTFTSFNLALNLSFEQDTQVLLVDADVAKRSLSATLGILDKPGLLDMIEDPDADIESAVLATNIPGLFLLPSGQVRENSVELLESPRLKKMLHALLADVRQCLIVFDTPPLLLTAESRAVTGLSGQVILVVMAGGTSRAEVINAAGLIQGEDKFVACVLNQSDPKPDEALYGYYYGPDAQP